MKTPQTDRVMISDKKFEILRLRTKGTAIKSIALSFTLSEATIIQYLSDMIARIDCARKGEHRLVRNRY